MQSVQSYPIFEADQVLSKNHLNNVVNYLEQQQRLTRVKFTGRGIGCGLNLIINSDQTITITEGFGLTSQGYLIQFCESTFSKYIDYKSPSFPNQLKFLKNCNDINELDRPFYDSAGLFKLLPVDHPQVNSNKSLSDLDLSEFCVILFLEARQMNLKNCDTRDCDDKGSRMDFEVVPLLVPKNRFESREAHLPVPFRLRRFNIPTKELKSGEDILDEFLNMVHPEGLTNFELKLSNCWEVYAPLLGVEGENPFNKKRLLVMWNVSRSNWEVKMKIQYFIDFLNDLEMAYAEFIKIIEPVYGSCPLNTMIYPLHLNLGLANESTGIAIRSPFRHYFQKPPQMEGQFLKEQKAAFLLRRLGKLSIGFSWENIGLPKVPVITPSLLGKASLSKRAIPFYYNWPEVDPFWNFKFNQHSTQTFNLGYGNENVPDAHAYIKNPLEYDLEKYNFFRIEGHVGRNYRSVLKNIQNLKSNYSLPFHVIALNSNHLSEILNGQKISCHVMDLESDYRVMVTGLVCQLQHILNIVGNIPSKESLGTINENTTDWSHLLDFANIYPDHSDITDILNRSRTEILNLPEIERSNLNSNRILLDKLITKPNDNIKRFIHFKDQPLSSFLVNQFDNFSYFKLDPLLLTIFLDQIAVIITYLITHDLENFEWKAYEKRYKDYTVIVKRINKRLIQIENSPLKKHFNQENEKLFFKCTNEKLLVLLNEYQERLNGYQSAVNFHQYYKKNPGMEHKAGVTKGGTFIIVYNRQFSINIPSGVPSRLIPYRDFSYGKIAQSIRDLKIDLKEFTIPVLRILDKKDVEEKQKKSPIPDESVIADFYLPYLCCSDCPPIAYVIEEKEVPEEEPKEISLEVTPREFCENDRETYPVVVSPLGGTLFINEQEVEEYQFIPYRLGAGTHLIMYEMEDLRESLNINVLSMAKTNIALDKTSYNATIASWEIAFRSEPISPLPLKWRIIINGSEYMSDLGYISHVFPANTPQSTIVVDTLNSKPCPPSSFKKGLNFHQEKIAICKRNNRVYSHSLQRDENVILVTEQDGVSTVDNVINLQFENIVLRNNEDLIVAVYQESEYELYFTCIIFELLDASFTASFQITPTNNPNDDEIMLITLKSSKKGGTSTWWFNEEIVDDQFKYPLKNIEQMESFRHIIEFENIDCSEEIKVPINTEGLHRKLRSRRKYTMFFSE